MAVDYFQLNLEVVRLVDLAGKFQQLRKFVEIAESEIIRFYADVCQSLKNWVAPAPRMKTKRTENEAGAPPKEIERTDRLSPDTISDLPNKNAL